MPKPILVKRTKKATILKLEKVPKKITKKKAAPAKVIVKIKDEYKPIGVMIGHGKHAFYSYGNTEPKWGIDGIGKRGYRFSLLDQYNQMVLPWVSCKDFFNDIMYSQIWNLDVAGSFRERYQGAYIQTSYMVKSSDHRLDTSSYYKIAVRSGEKNNNDFRKDFFKAFKVLKAAYKELGLEKPKIAARFLYTGHLAYVLYLPNRLFFAGPLISFSLTILRTAGGWGKDEHLNVLDKIKNGSKIMAGEYLANAVKFYEFCLANKVEKIFTGGAQQNWPECHLQQTWNTSPGNAGIHATNGHDNMMSHNLTKIPYYTNFLPTEEYLVYKGLK